MRDEEVTPVRDITIVDEDVHAASLLDFELWWNVLEATQTWSAFTLDEDTVTRPNEFIHFG